MPLIRRLATLAAAAEAARRYAKKNPDQAARYLDQAARFVDKQTKGRYSSQITGVAQKAKGVVGIRTTPGSASTGNGHVAGYDQNAGYGRTSDYTAPRPTPRPSTPPASEPYSGTP